jgi:hypothetical protein
MLEYSKLPVRITKTVADDIWTEVNAQWNNQHPFWTHREDTKHWRWYECPWWHQYKPMPTSCLLKSFSDY